MREWLQKKLIRFLVKDLFNTIDTDDILRNMGGDVVYFKGRKLEADELSNLISQAVALRESLLWKVLTWQARWSLNRRMYDDGDNVLAGQMGLYNLKVFEDTLRIISSGAKVKTNSSLWGRK